MEFDVVIEVPKGGRNKYEMDHKIGRIRLDRTLFTATSYPGDYGFIEHTLARHLRDIIHVSQFYKLEIQHFFEIYKELEPGKVVESGSSWVGRAEAESEIVEAQRRAKSPIAPSVFS